MPFLYFLDICRQPSRALDTLLETFNTIALPNKEGKLERHKEIKGKMVRTWLLGQWIWHFLSVLHGLAWHDTLFVPFMIFHVWMGAVLHQNGVTQYPFACVCSFSPPRFLSASGWRCSTILVGFAMSWFPSHRDIQRIRWLSFVLLLESN